MGRPRLDEALMLSMLVPVTYLRRHQIADARDFATLREQ
jgi:hypothetical protein